MTGSFTGAAPAASSNIATVQQQRAALWANGYRPLAVHNAVVGDDTTGKNPFGDEWRADAQTETPMWAERKPKPHALNTGILTDDLVAVDVDLEDAATAGTVRTYLENMAGDTIVRFRPNSARCLLLYRASDPLTKQVVKLPNKAGKVEFLANGQQFVAFGAHYSGVDLQWEESGSPLTRPASSLPAVSAQHVRDMCKQLAELLGGIWTQAPRDGAAPDGKPKTNAKLEASDPLDVAVALMKIPNDGPADWDHWNQVGLEVHAATGGSDAGLSLWRTWSAVHEDHDDEKIDERWEHFHGHALERAGMGSLVHRVRQIDPSFELPSRVAERSEPAFPDIEPEAPPEPPPVPLPRALAADTAGVPHHAVRTASVSDPTEAGVAVGFAKDFAGSMLYDVSAGGWVIWDGRAGLWREDDTLAAKRHAFEYVAEVRALYNGAETMAKASFIDNIERLARSNMAARSGVWDTDPWLLCVPGGYVDLRTGIMHKPDPKLRMRKQTAVAPAPGPAPLWDAFLDQATGGDADLKRYLQKLAGYLATGMTNEEMFAFLYGLGGTGKSTWVSTLAAVLGTYATTMPIETFSANAKNPEYARAAMQGARLVSSTETERGSQWAESAIKEYTGNEGTISARQIYGRMFEYVPTFKILILGNSAPKLRGGENSSMKRRLHVVPFDNLPAVVDLHLKEKLRAEYPQILAWIIDGCLMWRREGLTRCQAVERASDGYFEEQDTMRAWADERLVFADGCEEKRTDLLHDFAQWCRANSEPAPIAHDFYTTVVRSLGLKAVRTRIGTRMLRGAAIRGDGDDFLPEPGFADVTQDSA